MKAQLKIAGLLIISMIAQAASATGPSAEAKGATRIDFNRMIDDNNNARKTLQKDLANHKVKAPELDGGSDAERTQVIDFVDVEVGWGESAPVVDRRFDSIGEAKVYQPEDSSGMQITLINK